MNTNYEQIIKKNIAKAIKKDEIPVVAIVLLNKKIISVAYNKRETNDFSLEHAEIIAIKKASKKLKTWKLNDCEMITTLKPCKMCEEIIKESRIKKVYYYLETKYKNNLTISYEKINNKYTIEYKKIFKNYFKTKRIK